MTTLAKIQSKLHKNYKDYLKDNDLSFLESNIALFQQVDKTGLSKELRRAPNDVLAHYTQTLFIVAEGFVTCAYEKRTELKEDAIFKYLQQAKECYDLISHHIRQIPPFSLDETLGAHLTQSEFFKHKIKFQIAQAELFLLKQQIPERGIPARSLQSIKQKCEDFKYQLQHQYRDHKYQALFQIDALIDAINFDLEEIKELTNKSTPLTARKPSDQTPIRQTTTRQTSNAEKTGAPKKRKRHLEVLEATPMETNSDSLPRSQHHNKNKATVSLREKETLTAVLDKEEEDEEIKPVRRQLSQKEKEAVTGMSTLFQVLEEKFIKGQNTEDLEKGILSEITIPEMPKGIVRTDLWQPQIASSIGISPLGQTVNSPYSIFSQSPSFNPGSSDLATLPVPATPITNSTYPFWTAPLNPVQDSRECFRVLSAWENAYFSTLTFHHDENIAAKDKKSLTLEKLGQILLIAANKLQRDSEVFASKDVNPALRLAILLLIKSAETYHDRLVKPTEISVNALWQDKFNLAMGKLSQRYRPLLEGFLDAKGEDYALYFLMQKFRPQGPLINIHGVSIEGTVQLVFEALSKNLPAKDYEEVKKEFISAFKQATSRIGPVTEITTEITEERTYQARN